MAESHSVEEVKPCPVCGCEERTPAGYLQCECPAQRLTTRVSPATGKPYPRCCIDECDRPVYSDRLCWGHFVRKP